MGTISATVCTHHWMIKEPDGMVSEGRCKYCGRVKDFRNFSKEFDFVSQEEHRWRMYGG